MLANLCPTCPGPFLTPEGDGTYPIMVVADHLEVDKDGQVSGKIEKALVGRAGGMLARQLTRFGIRWSQVYTATAAMCAPKAAALGRCAATCGRFDAEVARVQPRVFVPIGALACQRLLGRSVPPHLARGYVWPEAQGRGWVIPALPPSYYLADPGLLYTFLADITKALWVARQAAFRYLEVETIADPPIAVWDAYVREFLADPTRRLAVDTEYPWKRRQDMSEEEKAADVDLTDQIDEINVAFEDHRGASVSWRPPYIEGALAMLHASQQHGTTLFWNTPADGPRLHASGGPRFRARRTRDVMDSFRVLRNSVPRKLATATSLLPSAAAARPWKHLGTGHPFYRVMDAVMLLRNDTDIQQMLRDEGAAPAHRLFLDDLNPLLEAMTEAGLLVDVAKVEALARDVEARLVEARARMTAQVDPSVRPLKVYKVRSAAERAAAEVGVPLEDVPGTATTTQCVACGALGVTKAHVLRKTQKVVDAGAQAVLPLEN